jgi:hypothetical protein
MINNAQGQRIISFSRQVRGKSAWDVALGIALLGVVLSAAAEAAVFTVNSPSDVVGAVPLNDGICATAYNNGVPNGVCTLRAAIMEANHAPEGPHTISIPAGTYILIIPSSGTDNETSGALKIAAGMSIIGAGSLTTIIDANGSVTSDRGFRVVSGVTANIAGVTIRNGAVSRGGGIANVGGGIYNEGTLTLTNTRVSGNSADFSGGIENIGTLTLINSTVSDNSARGAFISSGGINNSGGTLTLINTTVSNNRAGWGAAGIFNSGGTLTLTNSTVSGNIANDNGGGIYNNGTANVFNSTITNNRSDADNNFAGTGGGVFNQSGRTFTFQNTIFDNNFNTFFGINDCAGTLTSTGNNLMTTVPSGCSIAGSVVTIAPPLLGPLQDNGGSTQTHALLAGSPAIDAGNPGGCRDQFGALLTTDQRGFPRPAVGCDIGAYELLTGSTTSVVAALLPGSRSVQVNVPATAFATVINTGQGIAASCDITPLTSVAASFQYQTTDPATNQVTGFPNTPVNIAAGAAQTFVFAVTPTAAFPPTDVQFSFDCANSDPAPINTGLNTLLLSASANSIPDIVTLAATNGGIVEIPGVTGIGAFAVATVNLGATGTITASADTGAATLPVNITLCETTPSTGACISAIGPTVTTTINANGTPTFGIFVEGNGNVPFDPAANRIFVRFRDAGGVTRGSTSVAVRTQ